MSAPRGFAGAILVLWGVSNGFTLLGVVMGVVLEALRLTRPVAAMTRSANVVLAIRVSVFLVVGGLVVAIAVGRFPDALYSWLRWLPVLLLPLPLAASLAGGSIPNGAFLVAMRVPATVTVPARNVNVMFGYAAATLVAAGTGAAIEPWFYLAAMVLVAWALVARMPRGRRAAGVILIAVAASLGYGVHRGLFALQGQLEELDPSALLNLFQPDPDPLRERTRIGDVGRVKLNDRIVMRVFPEGSDRTPRLLREAAFDRYRGGEWQASKRTFQAVPHEGDRWILHEGPAPLAIAVRRTMSPGESLLALPAGAHVVDSLPAESVDALPSGAVRAKGAPRFVTMQVSFDELDPAKAGSGDTSVPEELAPLLDRVIEGEHLRRATAAETVAAVEQFFSDHFAYSLFLAGAAGAPSRTLSDFLLRDRKGHCEYFATSTALLLRRAGVPAVYTVGYSAQEYSNLERAFVVRSRHAHAWASALVDGRWITVDTTPSRWAADEQEAAHGFFAPMLDRISWAVDRIVQWWVESTLAGFAWLLAVVAALALMPLVFILIRSAWRSRAARVVGDSQHPATKAWRSVEAAAARRGHVCPKGETALAWSKRLRDELHGETWSAALVDLARDYYRARFDPAAPAAAIEEFVRAARAQRSLMSG